MKQLKNFAKNLWKDESGQGTVEYILLLVVVVAVVFAFRGKIKDALDAQMGKVDAGMAGITVD